MSTLKVDTVSNLAGTNSTSADNVISGSAKAWVNFNGTGTVAIRASYNVSSITDASTGNFYVNFTTAFSDANYVVLFTGGYQPGVDARIISNVNSDGPQETGRVLLRTTRVDGAQVDSDRCNVAAFR